MSLEPELIPEPLWRISAARLLGSKSKAWRGIRSAALAAANDTCSACGEAAPGGKHMVCDEVWSYDEQHAVATLTGMRILCPACDHARHFARAAQLGRAADALSTLARVNGITEQEARAIQKRAHDLWERRSRLAWTVRVSEPLLVQYPVLAVLDGQHGNPGEGRARAGLADRRAQEVRDKARMERLARVARGESSPLDEWPDGPPAGDEEVMKCFVRYDAAFRQWYEANVGPAKE